MVKYYGRARQRVGSVNTNQLGLKMSGCPSKVGRSGRIDRYISRRSHCGIVFCGWVWYHGIKWKQNHWVNPYTKEINWRCIPAAPVTRALAGGVGRLNAPRFRCAKDCGRQPWWSWTNQPHSSPLGGEYCELLDWMKPFEGCGWCQWGGTGTYMFTLTKNCTLSKSITIPNMVIHDFGSVKTMLIIEADLIITGSEGGKPVTLQVGDNFIAPDAVLIASLIVGQAVPGATPKGSINNYASIIVQPGGSLVINHLVNNLAEGTITNAGGNITVNRPPGHKGLHNAGVINNVVGQFVNNGVVNNYAGTITNAASFFNMGTLQNFSSYVKPLDTGAPGDPSAGGTRPVPSIINTASGILRNGGGWRGTQGWGIIINGGGIIHNNGGHIYNTKKSIIRNSWLINNTLGPGPWGPPPRRYGHGEILNNVGGLIINTTSYAADKDWPITRPAPLHPSPQATCFWSQAGIGKIVNDQACTITNEGTIIIQGPLESDAVYDPAPTQFQNNGKLANTATGKIYLIDHSDHATTRGASQFNNGTTTGVGVAAKCFNKGLIKCTTTEDAPVPQQKTSPRVCTTGTNGCMNLYVPIEHGGNSPEGKSDCS